MKFKGHRKQVVLFLTAVLLPTTVLVALTLRMIRQERELTQKRVADERRTMVREIRQDLASRLDGLVRSESAALAERPERIGRRKYVNPEVVLLARAADTRLILPWDIGPDGEGRSAALRDDSEFSRLLGQAETAEFSQRNFALAASRYGKARSAARSPAQAGYARLQRARSLLKSGRADEALGEYEKVLALPPGVLDEYGVPLALYAADPLLGPGSARQEAVVERVGSELRSAGWLSPAGVYLMKDILGKAIAGMPETAAGSFRAAAENNLRKVLALIQVTEQALSLKEDFSRLGLVPFPGAHLSNDRPLWVCYGQKPWLVGMSLPLSDGGGLLAAVDFQRFSASSPPSRQGLSGFPETFKLITGLSADGTSLAPGFPGLSVVFGPAGEEAYSKQGSLQRVFYFVALAVVLSVTLFGAYLLWRDVRREVQMAEMRSQFVSSVSHELKTPLTAIRMFAETLRLGRSRNPAAQAEYLDTIVNESERLSRLLNNVLDFSKIEQGRRTYHPAPCSLAEVVRTAARAMEYPLKQQGFELDVRVDDSLPQVPVDHDAIEQAVLNLLSNAVKYSGPSRWIGLVLRREGDRAVVEVVDRGLGIEVKEQEKIFEKFYRVPTAENRSLPGTGLGLALVAHIARAHGGSVAVKSRPGEGSTFSILLPLEAGA